MDPPAAVAKPISVVVLFARVLLLGAFILSLRFAFVVFVHGRACDSGDFCLFSSPALPQRARQPSLTTLVDSRRVAVYSSFFNDLVADGFLVRSSRVLCVDADAAIEVSALKAIGMSSAAAMPKKAAATSSENFDFVFLGRCLDSAKRPVPNIASLLKYGGFCALHTSGCNDLYSQQSLTDLFSGFKLVRSRELGGSREALREFIFQKMEPDEIPNISDTGDKFMNKCSIHSGMLGLVNSAEQIIATEPVKPWITLKKNLQNIKYLPSIVDIRFKRRYMYIDVGARSYGSSIGSWFKKQYPKQNQSFEIFAIEADKAFHREYHGKKGVTLLPFAAWIRNESVTFEINREHEQDRDDMEGCGMGRIRPTGSSNVVPSSEVHAIQGFNFAEWLKRTVMKQDYVVMKMDVEGTEFDLVPMMLKNGAICLVDELFLECHYNRWQKCCPGKRSPKYKHTYRDCLKLFTLLRESGVLVHQWW